MSGRPGESDPGSEERLLRAVDPNGGALRPEVPGRRGWLGMGLLALLLVAVAVAYALERDRSVALGAEVEKLEGQLATVQAEVKAHESRLADVRHAVGELSARFDGLQSLVRRPVEASPASPEKSATP